jgi:hypothetical protein
LNVLEQIPTASLSRDLLVSSLELLSRLESAHLSTTLAGVVRILTHRMTADEVAGSLVFDDQEIRQIYQRIRDKVQSS